MEAYTNNDLEFLLNLAIKASLQAGEYIVSNRPAMITTKSHAYDLVTEHDQAAEIIIREILSESKIDILGEELGGIRKYDLTWVIDPIDGTNNFVTGSPMVGVNIALFVMGEPILAVTCLPFLKELYTCIKGKGVSFNGVLLSDLPKVPASYVPVVLTNSDPLSKSKYPSRLIGAASVELAWCARGIFAAVAYEGVQPWDVAPGILFIRELGGTAKVRGSFGNVFESGVIIGNLHTVKELYSTIEN